MTPSNPGNAKVFTMGSKKRSAREKQKMAFLADLGNEDMGVSDNLFAAEDERRNRMHAEHEEALRYKSCERKTRYDSRLEAQDAISACAAHGRGGLTCYKCTWCGGWHLTSHPQR